MERARLARQPALGLAGITLVIPVVLFLGLAWGGAERSLLVLGPMSTFALPVIAMIAFWWEDWPGTVLEPPLSGLANTVLVAKGWPLGGLGRFAGGVVALAAAWGIGLALYETVVEPRPRELAAILVCI